MSEATVDSLTEIGIGSRTPGQHANVWLSPARCSLTEFQAQVEQQTLAESVPLASDVTQGIPVYSADAVYAAMHDSTGKDIRAFMAEWNQVFEHGAGIVAVRGAYSDLSLVDAVTGVLADLIEAAEASSTGRGDHFAPAGVNSRLWNAHEKLCVSNPELFARYNANPIVPLVSRSWLGPCYQLTTQVNVVRPGGKAQTCHRDYHMGFQAIDALADYPRSAHCLSASLTLQGAIAHTDMPVESGPTKLLPYSQRYVPGYIAAHLDEFRDYFEAHCVQLALAKGDALFFNPAVFHAAGENRTSNIHRFANLMQIGSAYGRSIEIVDRYRMTLALYPDLRSLIRTGAFNDAEVGFIVEACAEGYPFPANLDLDSPLSGMAPPSQQDVLRQAIAEDWDPAALKSALDAQQARKRTH